MGLVLGGPDGDDAGRCRRLFDPRNEPREVARRVGAVEKDNVGIDETEGFEGLGLGGRSEISFIFGRRIIRRGKRPTPGTFQTKIEVRGVDPQLEVYYRSSRIKEYFKEGRALRIETVVNDPGDLGVKRRVGHLGELRERVVALLGALSLTLHQLVPFANADLRSAVERLWGRPYSSSQMSYDLRRLRAKGLIRRIERSHRYATTPEGTTVALLFTKSYQRFVRPLLAIDAADAPATTAPAVRQALRTIDRYVADCAKDLTMAA